MAAFSSAGQLRRRPAPVNTSRRRARSGLCVSSEIDICRSSQPAPNIILYARRWKAQPRLQPLDEALAGDFITTAAFPVHQLACRTIPSFPDPERLGLFLSSAT